MEGSTMKTNSPNRWVVLISLLLLLGLTVPMAVMAKPPQSVKVSVVSTNDFHGALEGRVHSWSHGVQ